MDKDQIILILLIVMAIVLTFELLYILLKKKRRKEEMNLFRKSGEPVETLADKAHNAIITAESISSTLSRQGVSTREADGLIDQAKRSMAAKNYQTAIERGEAAKLALLRAKREMESRAAERAAPAPSPAREPVTRVPAAPKAREEKSLDSLPTNYVQAKFMLATVRDLLEKRGITAGEAHDHYSGAVKAYDREDYNGALSRAIKAERLLDSGTLDLIGEEKIADGTVEVYVCPGCESEIAPDDAFCRECGQNLDAATECPACGTEFDSNDKFCRKCGQKLR